METLFFDHEHGKIAYDDTGGNGPLIICLPGIGDLRSQFDPMMDALRHANYRVVRMDFRGHGDSSTVWGTYSIKSIASDLTTLIDVLDAGPAIVVGTGMGASASAWIASEMPSKVNSLVLISPLVEDLPQTTLQRYSQKLLIKPWGPARWGNYYRKLYTSGNAPEPHVKKLEQNLKQRGRLYAVKRLLMASKIVGEPRLSQIQTPTLIVVGEQDPTFIDPRHYAESLTQHFGGLTDRLIVDNAGHYPHVEQTEQVAAHMIKFLDRAKRFLDNEDSTSFVQETSNLI
jgi:pimeloyl-ACP methyl ester carboxylesterase